MVQLVMTGALPTSNVTMCTGMNKAKNAHRKTETFDQGNLKNAINAQSKDRAVRRIAV